MSKQATQPFSIRILFPQVEAKARPEMESWRESRNEDYIKLAGWYFKTLAAQVLLHTLQYIYTAFTACTGTQYQKDSPTRIFLLKTCLAGIAGRV